MDQETSISRNAYTESDIESMLQASGTDQERLRQHAIEVMHREVGDLVYYRGIIEFSNICSSDCYYCGIRKSNRKVSSRYELSEQQIVSTALWCAEQGYGSVVLQSGERRDPRFLDLVERVIRQIKVRSVSEALPRGLGITLSIGEQSLETYQRLYDAGAHRYLLRIETTDERLFSEIHPRQQRIETRLQALKDLSAAGYQVGTGVMIGLPGQSLRSLAQDILFFRDSDIDMIGMGPYIVHPDSAMAERGMIDRQELLGLSFNMIAATRIVLQDVNIAATTALQALVPDGREQGLSYGANVTMPNLTPTEVRPGYQLYAGKPCLDESKQECRGCLLRRIRSIGRDVGFDMWGDAPHASGRSR